MENPLLPKKKKNPFLELIEKQQEQRKQPGAPLGIKSETTAEKIKKSTKVMQKGLNEAQSKRGGESLTSKAAKVPGSFVFSVNDARRSMGIKPGSNEDKNLKAVMARMASDGKVTAEEMSQILKMGKTGLYQKAQQYRDDNARARGEHERLAFTEDELRGAMARGDMYVKTKQGTDIPLSRAISQYESTGLRLNPVVQETEEQQQIRHAMSGGVVPVEGANFTNQDNFRTKRAEAKESAVSSIMAGAKSPFAQLLETAAPVAREGRLRALEIGREEGRTGKELLEQNKQIGSVAGDVGSLPIAVLGSGLGTKAVDLTVDAITAFPELLQAYGAIQSGSGERREQGIAQAALTLILGTPTGREVLGNGLQKLGEVSGLMKAKGLTFDEVLDDLDLVDQLDVKEAKVAIEDALKNPKIKQFADEYKKPVGVEFRDPNSVDYEFRGVKGDAPVKDNAGSIPAASTIPKVEVNQPAEIPKVTVPKELTGKVDETFLGKKADEWESRLAELQARPKKARSKSSGGLDPDVLEEAILRAGITIARAGEPIEKAIRSAMSQMGLTDDAFDEIHGGVKKELGIDEPTIPKQVESTGLANQVQSREAGTGTLKKVESAGGKSAEYWQNLGREKVNAGADYDELAAQVGRGDTEFTGERAGILLEGKRIKLANINKLVKQLEESPNDPKLLASLRDAQDELQTYVENVQKAKGRWSDVGRSLQAGSTVDEGNFADVIQRMEQSGKKVDVKVKAEIKTLTDQIAAKDKQIADLEANLKKAQAERIIRTPRSKNTDVARARVQKSKATIKELWDSGKFFANDGVAMSTILPTPPRLTKEAVEAIKDLAKSSVELGVKTFVELIDNVKSTLKENGIELDDQQIIDALATTESVERSELTETLTKLRAQAKKLSTEARNRRTLKKYDQASEKLGRENDKYSMEVQKINKQIEETKSKLDAGEYTGGKKDPAGAVNTRLGTLRAERDVYASKLRRAMTQHDKSAFMRGVGAVTQNIRGLKLGADVGILLRQGAQGLAHPKKYGKAITDGIFAAKSEANQMMLNRKIRDARYSDGRLAEYTRNKAGLSLTVDMNTQEELVVGRILQKLPGVGKFSGSLERFQAGFINSLRAQLFDSVAEKKFSLDELKSRARYINAATGRGNVKQVPELLSVIMTSPRYEVSRWQTILEGVRSPIEALRGNKGAVENVKDMGKMIGGVFALYKMAELAGYETQLDPTHTDFLKLRKGNDVWDISAGLAPRMRDLARLMATVVAPDFFNNGMSVAMKGAGRTISPGVSIPSQYGSAGAQMTLGKSSGAKKSADQIKNFLNGFEDEETKKGVMALMPLWMSSAMEAYGEEKNTGEALWTFVREWFGTGVSRYEKSSKDSQLKQLIKDAERRAKSRTGKKQ